jgi:hypothetical protein
LRPLAAFVEAADDFDEGFARALAAHVGRIAERWTRGRANPRGRIGNPRGRIGNPRGRIGNPRGRIGNPRGRIGNSERFVGATRRNRAGGATDETRCWTSP